MIALLFTHTDHILAVGAIVLAIFTAAFWADGFASTEPRTERPERRGVTIVDVPYDWAEDEEMMA